MHSGLQITKNCSKQLPYSKKEGKKQNKLKTYHGAYECSGVALRKTKKACTQGEDIA